MRSLVIILSLVLPAVLPAQHDSSKSTHAVSGGPTSTQAGQDAFAAVAEIVAILEADSRTDWRSVSIDALIQHLRDMNALVLRTTVRSTPVAAGTRFDIAGDPDGQAAATRMVREHANILAVLPEWASQR